VALVAVSTCPEYEGEGAPLLLRRAFSTSFSLSLSLSFSFFSLSTSTFFLAEQAVDS
jgi:hypothetical protein